MCVDTINTASTYIYHNLLLNQYLFSSKNGGESQKNTAHSTRSYGREISFDILKLDATTCMESAATLVTLDGQGLLARCIRYIVRQRCVFIRRNRSNGSGCVRTNASRQVKLGDL